MIAQLLLTAGGTLIAAHFAPRLWAMLPKTKLIDRFRQIEAEASPLISTAEKDLKTMAESQIVSESSAKIGAGISALRTQAAEAVKALADAQADIAAAAAKQGELDQANGHVADLTSQVEDLKAQLAAEVANHADDVKAITDLADQVAPQ